MSQSTKGYLISITGIVFWSTTGTLIGYLIANYQIPPLLLSFWRSLLVCVAMVPALFVIRRSLLCIERAQVGFFVFYGLVLAVFNSIWVLSVQASGAAVATVLAYSSAGFTAVLAWWFFSERLTVPKIVAVILSLAGCVLVAKAYDPAMWTAHPLGIVTGVMSGILFAGYNMLGKTVAKRGINPWTSILYSFGFAALFTLIFNLFPLPGAAGSFSAILPNLPVNAWLVLVILAFIPTVIGFGLYNASMNYLPTSTVSLLATSEPAMTAIEAYIFLGERMTVVQIIGSLIILSAVFLTRFDKESDSTA